MTRLARLVLYVGIVAVVFGLSKYHARYIGVYDFTGSPRFAWAVMYCGLHGLAAYAIGLPDIPKTTRMTMASSVAASIGAGAIVSLTQLIAGTALLPRFVVFGSMVGVVPVHLLAVIVQRGSRTRSERADRVLFVGSLPGAAALAADVGRGLERGAQFVGALSCAVASDDLHCLGDQVEAMGATIVVLDREALGDEAVVAEAARLHERGVRIRTMSLFYEEWLGKLPMSELERTSLLFDSGEIHRARYGRVKRVVDVGVGLALLGPLLVVLLVAALVNPFANRGPLMFRQNRVGKGGTVFTILKLRTMGPGSEGDVSAWTQQGDPRVTPFGRWLRCSHFDELPQVINILRGDLSIVGPRPEQPHYVEELAAKLPFYELRHLVRPGLTGWAQVKQGYAGDVADATEKLQYEFFYLRRQSVVLDLKIIGRTMRSVLGDQSRGR